MSNDKKTEEQINQDYADAFEQDIQLAKYLEAVEKGTLTPEQQKQRSNMRAWLGVKEKKSE